MRARHGAVAIVVVGALAAGSAALAGAATPRSAASARATASAPRVLLIGDSILDQEGSAAAFVLRQSGVNAKSMGVWLSGLLTIDQYDYGKTNRSGYWLAKAKRAITSFDPGLVGVYMNHNYWPPHPHDAAGKSIDNLKSRSAQRMIGQQARALITILRARHAKVFFIAPIPAGTIKNADPRAWNPIWRGYLPVLHALHVPIVSTNAPIAAPDGLRAETKPSCTGTEARVRNPNGDVHFTRFGASLAGTVLARYVAGVVHADLRDNAAPGDTTAALVPVAGGRGYWLVGCDGSVYDFGNAPPLPSARAALAGHRGVVAAIATPDGKGLWLVAADGTIANLGTAPALQFATTPPAPITDAVGVPHEDGLWATTRTGVVMPAGTAVAHGGLAGVHLAAKINGIATTHTGDGYWLTGGQGEVFAFGDALSYGSIAPEQHFTGTVAGIAASATDGGYWLVGTDGRVYPFGDAANFGNAVWKRPPNGGDIAIPGPAAGIVSSGVAKPGYWVFGTTGRVTARGGAAAHGSTNNLAVATQ